MPVAAVAKRAPSIAGASSTESAGAQAGAMPPAGALRSLEEVEAAHIQQVLDHTQGHKGHSAEILGISRPALDRKIKKYGLRVAGRG